MTLRRRWMNSRQRRSCDDRYCPNRVNLGMPGDMMECYGAVDAEQWHTQWHIVIGHMGTWAHCHMGTSCIMVPQQQSWPEHNTIPQYQFGGGVKIAT